MIEDLQTVIIGCTLRGTGVIALALICGPALRRLFGRNASHWLWLAALAALLWPVPPRTPLSLQNLWPIQRKASPVAAARLEATQGLEGTEGTEGTEVLGASFTRVRTMDAPPRANLPTARSIPPSPVPRKVTTSLPSNPIPWLLLVWLAGVMVMLAQLIWRWSGTLRMLRDARRVENARASRILEEFSSWRPVSLHVTSTVRAPALCGIWRGRILLPDGWLEELPSAELQSVLLHELGHHRRGDLICEWLFALARCLHWMNPAVWLAERCSRRERELACDGWALERCADPESYGDALLEALKRVGRLPAPCFGVVPMAHDLRQISSRLEWVSTYRPSPRWRSVLAWMPALAILAAVGSDPLAVNAPESSAPETHASAPEPAAQNSAPKEAPVETVAAAPLPAEKKSVEIALDLLRIPESTAKQLNLPIAADQSTGIQRVFSRPDFKALCARIRQSPDAEFLPAPRLVSQSGVESTAEAIRELRYGDQYTPPTKSGIRVPGTIETINLGMMVRWQADVRDDLSVHLEIHPELNRLLGFEEENGKLVKALAPPAGLDWLHRLTAYEMPVGAAGVPSCALQRASAKLDLASGEVAMVFGFRDADRIRKNGRSNTESMINYFSVQTDVLP